MCQLKQLDYGACIATCSSALMNASDSAGASASSTATAAEHGDAGDPDKKVCK